ncbi:lysine-specific demethylase 7A-like isoform X2 [Xenopus laevis]|uniref:Lysine-specific demethylase 7A-like isoform X2 n=1 Tax=Xenopus laevis TaxID=8355 RepID=A0A8J1MIM4_XENLA|nr:lysine-specific demethylase 7A-like isoform X2 [Xenopus laevis]
MTYWELSEEGNKPVKSQGIHGHCPISRPSDENPSHHPGRKVRRLRDHSTKTPSNLDILEHHKREVLKRLEMSPWEEVCVLIRPKNRSFRGFHPNNNKKNGILHN